MPAPDGWESIGHGRYSDGVRERGPIRSPRYIDGEPTFPDRNVTFDEAAHWLAIGFSGWNWKKRESCWIGFDVDSLTNHAAGVGISDEEMAKVIEQTQQLPYVETRRSTSSKGLHLYVMLKQIKTSDHDEHAAVARGVLAKMSEAAGYDFTRSVDCSGRILWAGHRQCDQEHGFVLIKPAEQILTESDLDGWRDHVEVVTKRRGKVQVRGVDPSAEAEFDLLTSGRPAYPLDDTHHLIIQKLKESGFSTTWVHDHHLLQTHTVAFQQILERGEDGLPLRGVFKTNSPGTDPGSPNCFAFPLPNGAWDVYRFSPGVAEHASWTQDGSTWTHCRFNCDADFVTSSHVHQGAEMPNGHGFAFDEATNAVCVIRDLGGDTFELPTKFCGRESQLKPNSDGRLTMRIRRVGQEAAPGNGWVEGRGGWWDRVFSMRVRTNQPNDTEGYDGLVRRVKTPSGQTIGWMLRDRDGAFFHVSMTEVQKRLAKEGLNRQESDAIMGSCLESPWVRVILPFQNEYPGGRLWNMDAPQFKFAPVDPGENPDPHPYWDRVLNHCFSSLNPYLVDLAWAQDANIVTGGQYGLAWIACCFRDPFEPLPFLFFYVEQESGKSIFHEALSLLVTTGVEPVARALTCSTGFNGELAKAVVAYVEEQNIAKSPYAETRMKEWTTAKTLSIRKMRTDAYTQPSTLHFAMMANDVMFCPVFDGDTRTTVIHVPPLNPEERIPKHDLIEQLNREASHFLYTLLNVDLPQIQGRLRLPVVETDAKRNSMDLHRSWLERFLHDECHEEPGEAILFQEFYDALMEYMPASERREWSKPAITKQLPAQYPTGKMGGHNAVYVGNISFAVTESQKPRLTRVKNRLKPQE